MSAVVAVAAAAAAAEPPLTSVVVVCRSQPRIAALPHVVRSVSAFLDCSAAWNFVDACQFGSVRLLDRLTARRDIFASSRDGGLSIKNKNREFKRGVDRAAAAGHLDVVRWLVRHYPRGYVTACVGEAAKNGHLAIVEWLYYNHQRVFWGGDYAMEAAVANNQLEVAKFLNKHTALPPCMPVDLAPPASLVYLLDEAAVHGDLVMLKWLHEERGDRLSSKGVTTAVDHGHVDAVQWMCATHPAVVPSRLRMDKAAANGHLEMVKWLQGQNARCTRQAMNRAAANGHLEIVKFLHANRSEGCSTDAMDSAAKNGFLDVVKWLHTHRTEGCTTRAMDDASAGGRLEMVQWLHANRTEGCTDIALTGVKAHRCEKVVEWLYEEQIFPRS
ncbi:hypothetical protein BBJ28_00026113 [Nothophytophthora sp. Chile5]|nr:hypothetical protein BBJ28_00026113 [Nothophytophthora sp. Chile5]